MKNNFRIATWNTKQGVAPRQPESALWDWIQKTITPDVIVLTEAKDQKQGFQLDGEVSGYQVVLGSADRSAL